MQRWSNPRLAPRRRALAFRLGSARRWNAIDVPPKRLLPVRGDREFGRPAMQASARRCCRGHSPAKAICSYGCRRHRQVLGQARRLFRRPTFIAIEARNRPPAPAKPVGNMEVAVLASAICGSGFSPSRCRSNLHRVQTPAFHSRTTGCQDMLSWHNGAGTDANACRSPISDVTRWPDGVHVMKPMSL